MENATSDEPHGPALTPIADPYLLVLFPVGFVRDEAGRWLIDPIWAKDLVEHTRYLHNLTLVSYELPKTRLTPEWVDMASQPALRGVRCVTVPRPRSLVHALWLLPRTWWTVWREASRSVVAHSGFSWPIGEAWLLGSMQWLHRNFRVVVIESAAWRLAPGVAANWRRRWRAAIYERINRFVTNRADLAIFTQPEYLRSLRTRGLENAHVIEASWIDAQWIIDDAGRTAREAGLIARAGAPLRLMFAGRLVPEKGIEWLVQAIGDARDRIGVELDIYGDGPSKSAVLGLIERLGLGHAVRWRGSLAYGAPFLAALREHDALVVPSFSDEQPRVVYDAYSQGVAVLASATRGLMQCVEHDRTGWLFAPGDAGALVSLLRRLAEDPTLLVHAGRAGIETARSRTHRAMHERRWALLQEGLARWRAR